jgi:long-chain acyl-CoA synthetase
MTMKSDYMTGPEWSELVVEKVGPRTIQIWKGRPRHVVDLLEIAAGSSDLDLFVQGERRISFGAFRDAVETGAAELVRAGVVPGARVLIVLYNSAEFLVAQWAAWRMGAVPVLGNRWWSQRDLAEVIDRVGPAAVVTDMPTDVSLGVSRVITPTEISAWFTAAAPEVPAADPRGDANEDDVALVLFTAGSTGTPKGVLLSHRNLIWTQQTLHNMRGGRPPAPSSAAEQKVALMTTPLFHNGAVVAGLTALIDGNRMAMLQGRFNPAEVLEIVQQERVTSWNAVPTMFSRVLQHPDFDAHDLSSLVGPSTGGTMVPFPLFEEIGARMPQAAQSFSTGYGMTEASFITIAVAPQIIAHGGTVGRAIPGVEIKILDPDENGEGEVAARSGAVMVGYFNIPDQPVDLDGWYHTGDVGHVDSDGFLFITGRSKDMVIRGGENVACPHVEAAIITHDDVLEVAVLGYPDDEFGEAIAAVVYPRPGANLTEHQLRAHVKGGLAYFEVPSRWIFRTEPLPVLPTGKIDKRGLARELFDDPSPSRV